MSGAIVCHFLIALGVLISALHVHGATLRTPQTKTSTCARCLRFARNFVQPGNKVKLSPRTLLELARLRQEVYCRDAQPLRNAPRPMPRSFTFDEDTVLHRIQEDPPVYLNLYKYAKYDIVSNSIHREGAWESKEKSEILWALAHPLPMSAEPTSSISPALFVDVGANLGSLSLPVAAAGYEVIGFEAMPDNQRMLRNALCATHPDVSSRVTLHPVGLGAVRDTCYLLTDYNWGNGVPVCGAHNESHAESLSGSEAYRVRSTFEVHRLDDMWQADIKVLKIDTEGFEPMVLAGAYKLLRHSMVWFITLEYNKERLDSTLKGTPVKPVDHVLELVKLGYRVSTESFNGPFLSEQELLALAVSPEQCSNCNMYFTHPRVELREPQVTRAQVFA